MSTKNFIHLENTTIFYSSIGKGKPLIVLHGGPGLSQQYLLPQMQKLAKKIL